MKKLITLFKTIQTGQFWYLFPHYYYLWKRSIDIEKTAPLKTAVYGSQDVIEVHMLTGVKHCVDLLYAAKSFIHHYQLPISLIIHADISVTDDVVKKIQRHLPDAKIFTRQERDDLVEPKLEKLGLKYCRDFRKINVFGAKLIDAFLLSSSTKLILLDTDCLAFKSLDKLKELATKYEDINVFAKDPQAYPYSISPAKIQEYFQVDIKPYFCAGFCLINRQIIDFNLIEKWLSLSEYPVSCHYAEQTITAALVSQNNSVMLSEHEYNTGRLQDEKTCSFIHYCGHYLSSTRIAMRKIGQSIVLQQLINNYHI
jgi:lipopolysaccharide biosynthesis glycosyltransferase